MNTQQCPEHCSLVERLDALDEKVSVNNAMLMALCRRWRVTIPGTNDIEIVSKRFTVRGPAWAVTFISLVTAAVTLIIKFVRDSK